jgi:hypothetical protein
MRRCRCEDATVSPSSRLLARVIVASTPLLGCAVHSQPTPQPRAGGDDALLPTNDSWKAQRTYPPLVFTSEAYLHCSISSTRDGLQSMTTTSGNGFTFSSAMKPIAKSQLELRGNGMRYKFDAYPSAAFPASFSGLGDGTITTLKAEVEVAVRSFRQPAGAGTEISFDAADIEADAAYVEFTGLWVRNGDGKRFPFRVLFSRVAGGGGKVVPATPAPQTSIASKMVAIGTPARPAAVTTSLFEEEADMEGPSIPAPR